MSAWEWEVQGFYAGHGWECLTTEESRREALARLDEYRANAPGTSYRVARVRAVTS